MERGKRKSVKMQGKVQEFEEKKQRREDISIKKRGRQHQKEASRGNGREEKSIRMGGKMHQHVKKQHRRRDLSIRFNDQNRGQKGGGASERRAYLGRCIE